MKIRRTRLQNIIIGLLCLLGQWLSMDRLFLYLGIYIWIWASKHSATWHVSGFVPMCCMSRQEAGNIMMVPVISVACRQFKTKKHALFLCPCVQMSSLIEASICRLVSRFTTGIQNCCQSDWSFISPKLVLRMFSIFSRNNLWFLLFYLRAHGCFLYGWCSPSTWTLKYLAKGQT